MHKDPGMGLFDAKKHKRSAPAQFPAGRVGYAIGDIHGRADLLRRMFDRLEQEFRAVDAPPPLVVLLGDYVDRGPDSRAVIELLISGRPRGFEWHFLKGNHEAAMLAFLDNPVAGRAWLSHGGLETLAAYEVYPLPALSAGGDEIRRAGAMFAARLPDSHRRFLDALERYVTLGDYCFVHAGVDPARKLDAQTDGDLFWIRRRFLDDERPLGFRVVHGHTPSETPHQDHRRIGLDTGAYFSGVLSGARFENEQVRLFQVR
jgi:serine/threonine protein phosphatase 1